MRIIDHKDYPFLQDHEGKLYLRDGITALGRTWTTRNPSPHALQAPELMGYEGARGLIDPDVFAVGEILELLTRDMAATVIMRVTSAGAGHLRRQLCLERDAAGLREVGIGEVEKQFNERLSSRSITWSG